MKHRVGQCVPQTYSNIGFKLDPIQNDYFAIIKIQL